MHETADFFGVAAGILGASFSLAAACSRWLSLSPTTGMFWIKRLSIVALGFLLFSGAALSQVPGHDPGWWLDQKDTSAPVKQKSPKVIVSPHVKIVVRDHVKKVHIHHHRHARHHWHLRHHRHHRRHCLILLPWCWR